MLKQTPLISIDAIFLLLQIFAYFHYFTKSVV